MVKIPGGGIHDSSVVRGMVLKRDAEGTVKRVTDGKVAVFAQGIDTAGTETKARALLRMRRRFGDLYETMTARQRDAHGRCSCSIVLRPWILRRHLLTDA